MSALGVAYTTKSTDAELPVKPTYRRLPALVHRASEQVSAPPCRRGSRRLKVRMGATKEKLWPSSGRTSSKGCPTTAYAAHNCHSDRKK